MKIETVYDWHPGLDEFPRRQLANYSEITDKFFRETYESCKKHSMLFIPGFYNIYTSLHHISRNRIPGDIVECGCFLGGSTRFMLDTCLKLGLSDRKIIVFDTFTGFPPDQQDSFGGKPFHPDDFVTPGTDFREQFISNISSHPLSDNVTVVTGMVEEHMPQHPFGDVSLARLDTDFYSSTRTELEILYPRLSSNGVLIIDDYGSFDGCRRATDEYFEKLDSCPLLFKVDRGTHACVKPAFGDHTK